MGNKICSVNTGKKQNAATYRRRSRAINIDLSLLRELPGGHGAQHGASANSGRERPGACSGARPDK